MKNLLLFLCVISAVFCADDICGGTYRGFQYTITSPNYPRDYSKNSNCIYILQGEKSEKCEQQFHLQFLDFNVKSSENCKGDYLQVGERHVFCGSTAGLRKFTGKNNTLTVIFHSNDEDSAKGFKILVTAVPCSLKLNPLKESPSKETPEYSRSKFDGHEMFSSAYRRGVGVEDNTVSDINLPAAAQEFSTQRSQIDFTAEDNTISSKQPSNQNLPRITSYLFLPPGESNRNSAKIRNEIFDAATSPPNELLPPSFNPPIEFSKNEISSLASLDKSSSYSGQVQKSSSLPARNYGEPGIGVVDYDVQVGTDCDKNTHTAISEGIARPSDKINNDYLQGQYFGNGGSIGSSGSFVYDPRHGFVNNNYPGGSFSPSQGYLGGSYYPSSSYPNYNPSIGLPENGYNPLINYPNGNYYPSNGGVNNPGLPNYPVGGYEQYPNYPNYNSNSENYPGYNPINPNYNPSYNPIFPNYNPGYNSIIPNYNPSYGGNPNNGNGWNNGLIGQNGECCRVQSSRRFSIASPGFGSFASTNSYTCRFTITKSSPEVCRLRLSFRFFNFGIEDVYCSNGYVEIDGQRYCGCKTGQNLQILFTNYIAKTISVVYSGYPRTKFNGFLIDVIQESCGIPGSYPSYSSYSSYPQSPSYIYDPINPNYVKRRREVRSSIEEKANISSNSSLVSPSPIDPNPHIRNRRDLGYSYPRPNVSFINKDSPLNQAFAGSKSHERFFGGRCQNLLFLDWAIASKEAFIKNARCGGSSIIPGFNARASTSPTRHYRSAS